MNPESLALPARPARLADWLALTKPRLNSLVVLTAAVGYGLARPPAADLWRFLHAVVGTALVAGGAAAFNQIAERDTDRVMHRTRGRPLADGRVHPADAARFGSALILLGLATLAWGTHPLAAAVALATFAIYAGIYTPLKRRTPYATFVGAVPGALPPVIGWAAATGSLPLDAWVLFAIVFFWQIPHFLALAWLYREEFARAGLPVLPVVDPTGRRTAREVLLASAALLAASALPSAVGLTGETYVGGAVGLSALYLGVAAHFARARTQAAAQSLFRGSLLYLPLLWTLLLVCRR